MAMRGPDPEVTDDELLQAIAGTDYPFATISDVAHSVDLSRERVRQRLKELEAEGVVNCVKTGGVMIYWLSSE